MNLNALIESFVVNVTALGNSNLADSAACERVTADAFNVVGESNVGELLTSVESKVTDSSYVVREVELLNALATLKNSNAYIADAFSEVDFL